MNAKDYTFGIELELACPNSVIRNHNLTIGNYHNGVQVPFLPTGWTAQRDGSLRTTSGYTACEIVSPILKGEEGILELIKVLEKLHELGFKVAINAGTHFHIGWNDAWGADTLARLITIFSYLEKGLFATTGTRKRETGGYCKGIRKHGNAPKAKKEIDPDRYTALNISNLANNRNNKRTVEFRLFSGSMNATKIVGWLQLCLGTVERAVQSKRTPCWEPKPVSGGWKKSGVGQSELERALGYLKWAEGYRRVHGGRQYGWITDVIPQDEVKKELRRLAKKYDSES